MRIKLAFLTMGVFCVFPIFLDTKSNSQTRMDVGASLEALYAVSVSFVQVQLTVVNKDRPVIAVPLCGDSDICYYYAQLEQKEHRQGMKWKRTVPLSGGDVTFDRVVEVKRGEAFQASFRFNPLDWKFADGSMIRYPGKVRLAIYAWPKKEWIGHSSLALELLSNEFEIPSPPAAWTDKVR